MKKNTTTLQIIKNIFLNKVYLGIFLGSLISLLLLAFIYLMFIAPSFYAQMITNVTDEAKRIGNHIKWHQYDEIDNKQLEKLRKDFGLYKIRIFDKDGKITISTKHSEIGSMTTYKYFKTELPKGEIYYKVDEKKIIDEKTNKEKVIEVAEIYVPIMTNGVFDGASEVYFNISNQKEDFQALLDKTANILFLGALLFMTILFIVLFFSSKNNLLEKNKEIMMFEQSKLASLGEMIGNIAHQWRQPLSMISSSITTLHVKKEMGIMDDEDFKNTMDKILVSTKYLSDTIDDFRNFFDKNKEAAKINIKDLVNSTLSIVNDNLKNNRIELVSNLKDIEIEILENELKQVLINIINNAKDILISEKNATLDRKLIFFNTFSKNGKLHLTITDNAGGIDSSIINKIFEPYFTTKHKSIGTGIGLYMCKTIVENNMKGKIEVSNVNYNYDGKNYSGAKFTIII